MISFLIKITAELYFLMLFLGWCISFILKENIATFKKILTFNPA